MVRVVALLLWMMAASGWCEKPTATVVLLGQSGTGKSALGNVLLGRYPDFAGFGNGCFLASPWSDVGPTTKMPCKDDGHFLDNEDAFPVTVVDTPGLGFQYPVDDTSLKRVASFLKAKVKFANTFLVTHAANDYRMGATLDTFGTFEKMFGNMFWDGVVICVTFWNWSVRVHRPKEEKKWCDLFNQNLEERFRTKKPVPCVFLDAYFFRSDPEDVAYFAAQAALLGDLAVRTRPLGLAFVDAHPSQLKMLEDKKKNLTVELRAATDLARELVHQRRGNAKAMQRESSGTGMMEHFLLGLAGGVVSCVILLVGCSLISVRMCKKRNRNLTSTEEVNGHLSASQEKDLEVSRS